MAKKESGTKPKTEVELSGFCSEDFVSFGQIPAKLSLSAAGSSDVFIVQYETYNSLLEKVNLTNSLTSVSRTTTSRCLVTMLYDAQAANV